jgi:hypothetical protein
MCEVPREPLADTPRPAQARGDDDVAELCRFYGIIIRLFYRDHAPPHFHAEYGDAEAVVNIDTLELIAGELPSRALALVIEWAVRNRKQLHQCWAAAQQGRVPGKIPPLD